MYIEPPIPSFYQGKTLGRSLYEQIILHRPEKVVEFGIGLGFTTAIISNALRELGRGHLNSYDIKVRYQARVNVWRFGSPERVTMRKGDIHEWLCDPEPFDLLYVDAFNDGFLLRSLRHLSGIILFEGGTTERDRFGFAQYDPMSMSDVPYTILDPTFPSLSRLG